MALGRLDRWKAIALKPALERVGTVKFDGSDLAARRGNLVSRSQDCSDAQTPKKGSLVDRLVAAGLITQIDEDRAATMFARFPSDPADFTGRASEVENLVAHLREGSANAALIGMEGAGKSALALHVTHKVVAHYPDAQVFIDLRGTTTRPMAPAEAMAQVIHALDPAIEVPRDAEQVPSLYRSVLAGKKIFLLLDGAADAGQIEPMLPEPPAVALITSRQKIVMPGVSISNVDVMGPEDARDLLDKLAGPGQTMTEELDEIAELCGRQPLALRMAGTYLATDAALSAGDYTEALRKRRSALGGADHDARDIVAVLELSAARLALDHRDLAERWQMLSIFPADFDLAAASAVAWAGEEAAVPAGLWLLEARNLILRDPVTERYCLHEMVRKTAENAFGHGEEGHDAAADETRLAVAATRHADHYVTVLSQAEALYNRDRAGALEGLSLFDLERANIEAGQAWATARMGQDAQAAALAKRYPKSGRNILALRRNPRQKGAWLKALAASLGRSKDQGAGSSAIPDRDEAPAPSREAGGHRDQFKALKDLAAAGKPRGAEGSVDRTIESAREAGDRQAECVALQIMASRQVACGELKDAIPNCERQLEIAREIGNRRSQGAALCNLGVAYSALGEPRRSVGFYEEALDIAREIGDRGGESVTLGNLGNRYAELGESRRATEFYEQALSVAREIGDRHSQGKLHHNLAGEMMKLGQRHQAVVFGKRSLAIYSEIEDPRAEEVREELELWRQQS